MRVTSTSYYNSIYSENNKLNQQLFDVNKQISSGQKIQYAHEDPGVFTNTLRLDDEITTLNQTKNSTESAYKTSTQTDSTIGDIVKTLESMKVKLISAANGAHSDSSIQAIAKELRGLKNNLLSLSNTSIGGQFLFSGTATAQKPIDENGLYQGNDKDLQAFLGSQIKQKYNISGAQLFLGEENKINRTITTNITQLNMKEQYPDIMQDQNIPRNSISPTYITGSSAIRDLMGDTDINTMNDSTPHFYIQGTKSDGKTFKKHIDTLSMSDNVDDLLTAIKNEYGLNQVDVNINAYGQIEITDKKLGSSNIDFHMVGAVDFDTTNSGDAADVNDASLYPLATLPLGSIDNFQLSPSATTNFDDVVDPLAPKLLYIKEFTKSGFEPSDTNNIIEGINYDRTNFEKTGSKLHSNVSQIIKSDNSFAIPSTKLVDVAGVSTLVPTTINLQGKRIDGTTDYDISILLGAPSTFTDNLTSTNYTIYSAAFTDTNTNGIKDTGEGIATNADSLTYQQLIDIVNMSVTGSLPSGSDSLDYDSAITTANTFGSVTLDYAGRMVFEDKTRSVTQATLSIYDASSSNYNISAGSALIFNANNALTIRDPKTNFFSQIEEMIQSVEQGKKRADGSDTTDPRNIGIQNSIQMLDDLTDHVSRLQAESGAYSQVLQASSDRSSLLIVNTQMLRSDIIDTDIAEATMRMQQLSLNYQAMLSTISKVSKLSLVNYL